jgi:cobalamin synthase
MIAPLCFFFQLKGLVISAIVIGAMLLFNQVCVRKIGGVTGDTIGAFTEISEALFLLFFSILMVGWY